MRTGEILLISLGLVLHLFEATAKAGATQATMPKKKILLFGIIFGFVQFVLVALGFVGMWCIEQVLPLPMQRNLPLAASFLLLFLLGIYEIYQMKKAGNFEESRKEGLRVKQCVFDGLRMGLLSFIVGLGGYYIYPGSICSMACIWLILFLSAAAGLGYGYWFGWKGRGVSLLSGCVFIAASMGIFIG